MVRSLAPACPWVSTCVVHLSTYCLPSGWHNVGPQHSVLETIFRLEDCHPPPWAELTDPVSLQEPSGLLTKHPVVSVCWGRKGIGEGHFLLLPCVGGGRGEVASAPAAASMGLSTSKLPPRVCNGARLHYTATQVPGPTGSCVSPLTKLVPPHLPDGGDSLPERRSSASSCTVPPSPRTMPGSQQTFADRLTDDWLTDRHQPAPVTKRTNVAGLCRVVEG